VGRERNERAWYRQLTCGVVACRRVNSNVRLLVFEMDQELVASYIGKHLLVGVTYLDHNEQLLEKEQFHGDIFESTSMKVLSSSFVIQE
jgi:hypothetical protein